VRLLRVDVGQRLGDLIPQRLIETWHLRYQIVMWAVGIERGESRGAAATGALQYPRVLFTRERNGGATVPPVLFTCERGGGPAARAVRGAGNAGRGRSPAAGKREGFSF
jgi:hypothetical protein